MANKIKNEMLLAQIADGSIQNAATMQLPDPYLYQYYRFTDDRKFMLESDIDDSVMEIAHAIMLCNKEDADIPICDRKPIYLYIMSNGGYLEYAWMLIDLVLASETPVITVNMGTCASAAALIFMAGHRRLMFPRGTVMIHEGSASFAGDSTKVLDASENYKSILKKMHTYIISRTSISASTLSRKKANDWELDAETCLEKGVCTDVVSSLSAVM